MFEREGEEPIFDGEEETPPEESNNRTFLIGAAILGGIMLLSIICLAGYALVYLPRQRAVQTANAMTQVANDLAINQALTATSQSVALSLTPLATATATVTNTPVFAQASPTATVAAAASTQDMQTATVAAAMTQAAQVQLTFTGQPTGTQVAAALPNNGIADDLGIPGMVVMAVALVLVILLARRLRASPSR